MIHGARGAEPPDPPAPTTHPSSAESVVGPIVCHARRMDEIPLAGLAPGRLFVASFTDVGPDPDAALDGAGADVLVCLIEEYEIHLRFPAFVTWLDEHPGRSAHWPIPDWGTVPDDELLEIVDDVVARLRDGRGVILHCGAGIGRTGVVATLALVSLGMPPDEAPGWVRAHRGGAGPDSTAQMEQLERVTARLAAGR